MPKFKEIPPKPGHWIDWNGKDGPVIRDAIGQIVATDLHVTADDAKRLKERFLKELKENPPSWYGSKSN